MIEPAIRHVFLYIGGISNNDTLINGFEDLYTLIILCLQWQSLSSNDASITEKLYGLKRINNNSNSANQSISRKQKMLSLVLMILLPRLIDKLRTFAQQINEGFQFQSRNENQTTATSTTSSNIVLQYIPTRLHQPIQTIYTSIEKLHYYTIKTCALLFPYIEFSADISVIAYQIMYLCGKSEYHHPVFALLNMKLSKTRFLQNTTSNSSTTNIQQNNATTSINNMTNNWSVIIVLTLILTVRTAEYLRSHQYEHENQNLSGRLSGPVALPSVPEAGKVGRGCIIPSLDSNICSICNHTRHNPCASSSGYVFCYLCLLPYIREFHRCPVTGLHCEEMDIIRLYEEHRTTSSSSSTGISAGSGSTGIDSNI